jgi:hypothetical protein
MGLRSQAFEVPNPKFQTIIQISGRLPPKRLPALTINPHHRYLPGELSPRFKRYKAGASAREVLQLSDTGGLLHGAADRTPVERVEMLRRHSRREHLSLAWRRRQLKEAGHRLLERPYGQRRSTLYRMGGTHCQNNACYRTRISFRVGACPIVL